jgi:hypothetical protein
MEEKQLSDVHDNQVRSTDRIRYKKQHRSVKGQATVELDPGPNAMRHYDIFSCGCTKTNLPQRISLSPILYHRSTRIK